VPVDAIPVRPLTTATLEALDPQANHRVRLGHSSRLLKLRGKFWLIDAVFGGYFVPLGVKARRVDMGVPAERVQEFDGWQSGSHDAMQLTATPAQHFSGRSLTDRTRTLWASWILHSGEQRIFYSGDSGYFPGFKQIGDRLGGFDLALIENGAYDAC